MTAPRKPLDARCEFCLGKGAIRMCPKCSKSYDAWTCKDDGTLFSAMLWAARRAARFAIAKKGQKQ